MYTKALAFLALVTVAKSNDVVVGLKTDGSKFFDESRQANPALWRQMDNVTITAPENEVINRIVITDLRPEKDGDVKIVQGGEGQKNVTVELKSPTVLRGYDFHIEAYSSPEGQIPLQGDQQSTTEIIQDEGTASSNNPTDATSKLPDYSTDKNVPAVLPKDDVIKDGEREGRSSKIDNISTESTSESTTTLKIDITPSTQHSESTTENHSETSSNIPNKSIYDPTVAPNPSNTKPDTFNPIPAVSGRDVNGKYEQRQIRDTETDKPTISTDLTPKVDTSTENDKEATTTNTNINNDTFIVNRKYTSFIPSKVEHPSIPIEVKNEKLRNARDANDEHMTDESISTTTLSYESTTNIKDFDTSTLPSEDCVATEAENPQVPVKIGKDDQGKENTPIYLNNRQWNQRINNPTFQSGDSSVESDQKSPDLKVYPAILTNDRNQSVPMVPEVDSEQVGNDYNPTPDHMENKNPKISAIASFKDKNETPVISKN